MFQTLLCIRHFRLCAVFVLLLPLTISSSYGSAGCTLGDITAFIDSEPYHGAVLIFTSTADISNFRGLNIRVDLYQDGNLIQENTPVQVSGDRLVGEIVDLKFHLGSDLDIRLKISGASCPSIERQFSLSYDHFWPWMDWMLQPGDETYLCGDNRWSCYFAYNAPNCPNGLGSHSSWDICVTTRRLVPVFSGTEGVIYHTQNIPGKENVFIYNPYVGGIIQYGHTVPISGLRRGQEIHPGDLISHVVHSVSHIHYSVMRPLGWDEDSDWPYWRDSQGNSLFDPLYYRDPFYFHEPATWGYWYEDTVPAGWVDEMKRIFAELNPGVIPR